MADETKEIIYTIPLRKDLLKGPVGRRAPRAVNIIREYVRKHSKVNDVKVSKGINEALWVRGIQKPPSWIKVKVKKDGDAAKVMRIEELDIESLVKEEAKGKIAKLRSKLTERQTPAKAALAKKEAKQDIKKEGTKEKATSKSQHTAPAQPEADIKKQG
ncbi:MAG: 50S ribosomal protein L31e [Candidatus Aenigmarchaeota archaeon]|nr:50S ribosomal protein L31e [Candidatus Aenigmarchaeota archaeon]